MSSNVKFAGECGNGAEQHQISAGGYWCSLCPGASDRPPIQDSKKGSILNAPTPRVQAILIIQALREGPGADQTPNHHELSTNIGPDSVVQNVGNRVASSFVRTTIIICENYHQSHFIRTHRLDFLLPVISSYSSAATS